MASTVRVDPLVALPPELVLKICSLLPLADLVQLGELSRGWRAFAADEALWRDVELSLRPLFLTFKTLHTAKEEPLPVVLRALLRAPCLGTLHLACKMRDIEPHRPKVQEAACKGTFWVRKLTGADLGNELTHTLVRRVAPRLEELEVVSSFLYSAFKPAFLEVISGMAALRSLHMWPFYPRKEAVVPPLPPQLQSLTLVGPAPQHLRMLAGLTKLRQLTLAEPLGEGGRVELSLPPQLEVVSIGYLERPYLQALHRVPALRRLDLCCEGDENTMSELLQSPVEWKSPLPPGHRGLQWLRAPVRDPAGGGVSPATASVLSTVRAHAATLEELVLLNDDPAERQPADRLAGLLRCCGSTPALRRLTLERRADKCASRRRCRAQLLALGDVLRQCGAAVECNRCRGSPCGDDVGADGGGDSDDDERGDEDDDDDAKWAEFDNTPDAVIVQRMVEYFKAADIFGSNKK